MKKIKEEFKKLYKIEKNNILGIILLCLCIFLIEKTSKMVFTEILGIHLGLNLKDEFLTSS